MLTLILVAAISQVYEPDFYFQMAQENFVMDQLPAHSGYKQFIPAKLAEQVELWDDDCFRCRRRANEAVVNMGPSVIRYLFWPLRAKNIRISLHAEAVINKLICCQWCGGRGHCVEFEPLKTEPNICKVCRSNKAWHNISNNTCAHCNGNLFEIETHYYDSGYLIDRIMETKRP